MESSFSHSRTLIRQSCNLRDDEWAARGESDEQRDEAVQQDVLHLE